MTDSISEGNQTWPDFQVWWQNARFVCPNCLAPFMRWSAAQSHFLTSRTCGRLAREMTEIFHTELEIFREIRRVFKLAAVQHAGKLSPEVEGTSNRLTSSTGDRKPSPAGNGVVEEEELRLIEAELQRAVRGRGKGGGLGDERSRSLIQSNRKKTCREASGFLMCATCGMEEASGVWLPCNHPASRKCRSCAVVAVSRGASTMCQTCEGAIEGVGGW